MTSWFEEPSPQPRPPAPQPRPEPSPGPAREPVFNAPWPALAITLVIVLGYAVQSRFPDGLVFESLAFSPAGLADGRWGTLVSAMFLHGGWPHALMNAAFALAFGTPLARFYGERAGGVLAFFGFYLATGVLSTLGYAALHLGSPGLLVGASGAVSGLMGAAARLIAGRGALGSLTSPAVLGMGAALLIVNLLIAVLGGALVPGSGGAGIAWEAHLFGFAAGVFLAGPFARLAHRA
ncbi:MAG: rhomboid family intramembrane serine protease [Phenylobacterium sp.]